MEQSKGGTYEVVSVSHGHTTSLAIVYVQEALSSASLASDLCPASLSCAALRATMVVNVLVEASTAIAGTSGVPRPALPTGQQCEDMREQFQGAYEACKRGLAIEPVLSEPVICITTVSQKTCDPCCLVSGNQGPAVLFDLSNITWCPLLSVRIISLDCIMLLPREPHACKLLRHIRGIPDGSRS